MLAMPFIASAIAGLRGRVLGNHGAQMITTVCLLLSAGISLVAFYEVAICRSPVTIVLGEWLTSGTLQTQWAFTFDDLTVAMLLPVLCVSSMVHVYSCSYMESDPHTPRFFSYLSLFTASMAVLVSADSYTLMFVGWELIGVASYLLIGFWLTRVQASKSSSKAMMINRVGDTVLSIGFFACLWCVGSLDYATVLSVAPLLNETAVTTICLLFLGGAMSKSAQLPLQTWLADAMEGPTPVSALIHAATLVTAGVYLMLRSSPLLEHSPTALMVVAWLGAATAFYAATCGLLVSDVKRVIAFSTCSQLGYMVMALGLSQYHVALYHLVTHACFKALLFLAAGSVIHGMMDQQDLRRLGGLAPLLPFTYTAMLVGSLSLMALPGLAGFYSKDHLLELASGTYTFNGQLVYWAGTLSAMLTAFYSYRVLMLVFFSTPKGPRTAYAQTHEADFLLGTPLFVLSILAIVFGFLAKDLWLGMGTDFLNSVLPQSPMHVALVEAEFALPSIIKLMPLLVTLLGAGGAIILFNTSAGLNINGGINSLSRSLFAFFNGQWRWNALITATVINPMLSVGHIASKILDRGIIETAGPYGLATVLPSVGRTIASYDTSIVTTYALYIVTGFVSIVLLLLAPHVLPGVVDHSFSDVALVLVFISALPSLAPTSLHSRSSLFFAFQASIIY